MRNASEQWVVANLLRWFARSARDLPWRRRHDPYAIWVSEIMLQQTQVKTVIPFWERWMKRLPTIASLARARSQTIHKLWEGLGYYTRVRNMQMAARLILRDHRGQFPTEYEKVLALPGIGRYTAGAICSIACNQPTPILDGNVTRVLTRLFGIRGDPKEKFVNDILWGKAAVLVETAARASATARPGSNRPRTVRSCAALNQSLMELGALICTPKQPKCAACPVKACCIAARAGLTDHLPEMKPRPAVTRRSFVAFVLSHGEQFLVRQRPEGVLNGQLWEFPNVERTQRNGHSDMDDCRKLGGDPESLRPLCQINHSITRYRISLKAYRGTALRLTDECSKWLTLPEIERLPFSSAHKQILTAIRRSGEDGNH